MVAAMRRMVQKISDDVDKERDNRFQAGADDLVHAGPPTDRRCTDCCWILLFLAAQGVFGFVTFLGLEDGNPAKLHRPRDFQGAFCGVAENWNDGPNTLSMPKASYTMNLSSSVDQIFKQFVCSSAVVTVLTEGSRSLNIPPLLANRTEVDEYLCDCCISPCARCDRADSNGGDLTDLLSVDRVISERLDEITGRVDPSKLFNPSESANGHLFSSSDFWSAASEKFNLVCLPDCETTFDTVNVSSDDPNATRTVYYTPPRDDPLHKEWSRILEADSNGLTDMLQGTIAAAFTFTALPESICPYDAYYCVPMPGLRFNELAMGSDYCTFEMTAEVVDTVGSLAADAFTSIGGEALMSNARQEIGDFAGDFILSVDSFVVVAALSFVTGIAFLVLLRLTIHVCVWIAVFLTVVLFILGGSVIMIRSHQCQGADFFETGRESAVAVFMVGSVFAENLVTGTETQTVTENMTGDGASYRGLQVRTISGISCDFWDTQERDPRFRPENYSHADLRENYCRNPYHPGDNNKASTIWCFTRDPDTPWEICRPVGLINPDCKHGYAVASERMREILWWAAIVIWGLGGIWILIIFCLRRRIQLAIALNKVAALFLATNPHILIVPILQTIFAICWTLGWLYAASFLLSQVPVDYTPTGYYATYAEAYGTQSACAFWEYGDHCVATPGVCNDRWPQGQVWKTDDCSIEDGMAKCWRCYPPRFVMDWRFATSFFVFLWNECFNMALGQILIAMATAIWFFKSPADKRNGKSIVPRACWNVFRYHIGSVAFGSFIVAVVKFIRYLMKYFEKQAQASKNRVMVCVLKVLQCCIWCFEKCIQFLNKNAYIQIALTGKPFCTSAKKAFFLILRNALRFGTVAVLSGFIHFIGFSCIVSGTVVAGYFVITEMHPDISPVGPCITYGLIGYLASNLFMNVFSLAVDTSLQCFLVAEEMHEIGDFVPECLMEFFERGGARSEQSEQVHASPGSQVLGRDQAESQPAAAGALSS